MLDVAQLVPGISRLVLRRDASKSLPRISPQSVEFQIARFSFQKRMDALGILQSFCFFRRSPGSLFVGCVGMYVHIHKKHKRAHKRKRNSTRKDLGKWSDLLF